METDGDNVKKSPSVRHGALQSEPRTLLESPYIEKLIDVIYVRETAYAGSKFTTKECQEVSNLAKVLRPYVPKRWPRSDASGLRKHSPHVALRAPIVLIVNAVLQAASYPEFCRKNSLQVSPSTLYGLQLGQLACLRFFATEKRAISTLSTGIVCY
ncbi:hypothetical protein BGX26_012198 [Mortierella sp. AD094]|nr:hypothetical protein BGX26_012198 [Mortierella sp. AD094]